jgi:hypothetical protein
LLLAAFDLVFLLLFLFWLVALIDPTTELLAACLFGQVFGELYPVFELLRWTAEGGCAKWWMALQIIEKLEIVRKMVSGACGGTPVDRGTVFARKVDLTGVDGEALAGHGLGSNLSVEDAFL